MSRATLMAGTLVGLSVMLAAPAFAAKPKMLVQDLIAQGVEAHEAAVISTAACQAMSKSGTHDVLCGEDIRNMMRFNAMTAALDGSGCADEKCFASMSRAMKARYIVSGSVSKLNSVYILSLAIFDADEGRPMNRTEVKADSLEKLHLQVSEATSSLQSR